MVTTIWKRQAALAQQKPLETPEERELNRWLARIHNPIRDNRAQRGFLTYIIEHKLLDTESFRPLHQSNIGRRLNKKQSKVREVLMALIDLGVIERKGTRHHYTYRLIDKD